MVELAMRLCLSSNTPIESRLSKFLKEHLDTRIESRLSKSGHTYKKAKFKKELLDSRIESRLSK
jgi:hypothetical protein